MSTTRQALEFGAGTFLIAEAAWSIWLKDQVDDTLVKPATAGRGARIAIGSALIGDAYRLQQNSSENSG